ncbi:hypothetical protein GCM10022224_079250 [Nonomuraea antimicrobica]|uniref:Secreted protein n=1 Tax=Nonomuraea antimicrobica TaxID=561173 RepID=A0ABP7DAD4_9ACTN
MGGPACRMPLSVAAAFPVVASSGAFDGSGVAAASAGGLRLGGWPAWWTVRVQKVAWGEGGKAGWSVTERRTMRRVARSLTRVGVEGPALAGVFAQPGLT